MRPQNRGRGAIAGSITNYISQSRSQLLEVKVRILRNRAGRRYGLYWAIPKLGSRAWIRLALKVAKVLKWEIVVDYPPPGADFRTVVWVMWDK